ncbi:hypothetical protein [Paenibacillus sp. TAF43_2]|uniref:hypothetical protein n=1 Tax=Paenibacillus sp. TAF43_2 TaxID=3233069 RepID=UPI003F99B61F
MSAGVVARFEQKSWITLKNSGAGGGCLHRYFLLWYIAACISGIWVSESLTSIRFTLANCEAGTELCLNCWLFFFQPFYPALTAITPGFTPIIRLTDLTEIA